MTASDTRPDVAAMLERYRQAWDDGDLGAILDAYHTPCFVFKRGHVEVCLDEPAKRRYFSALLEATRDALRAGARWNGGGLRVIDLGRDACLATIRWTFADPHGLVLEDYLDSYHVVRIDGQWRFLDDTVHAPLDAEGG